MTSGFALFPRSASTISPEVDAITWALLLVTAGIVLLVFGLIIFFSIRYRQGSPHSRKISRKGQSLLEWSWTFATLGAFLGIFAWAAYVYFKMHVAPPDALEITAVGKQWMWKFQHPDGRREINELHVPVGKPVKLTLASEDVIHSLFVPEFRIKQDIVPGRYSYTWFQATKPGTYHLFCTQYCGTMHAEMRGEVIALSEEDYSRWRSSGAPSTPMNTAPVFQSIENPGAKGRRLFTKLGCVNCHGGGGTVQAPDLGGLYGKTVSLSDGTKVVADDNYIRESILNPRAKIVEGYTPIMPSFQGQLSEEELLDLIAYVKSIRADTR